MPRRTRSRIVGKRAQWEQEQRVKALKELRQLLRGQRPQRTPSRQEEDGPTEQP
jgi:hypothetical protein